VLHADNLTLKELQERLAHIPLRAKSRIVVLRRAQDLKEDLEDYIYTWAKNGNKDTVLILDIEERSKKEKFISNISRFAKCVTFRNAIQTNTFNLVRSIDEKSTQQAVKILAQILKEGERPERILGGLRYALENSRLPAPEAKRRVKLLLDCDIEIKTGRLKPVFALEKLVVKLCAFNKPLH
jgi:DNA polymerase III delta subunit